MKLKITLAALFCLTTLLFSCKKDSPAKTNTQATAWFIKYKVNGKAYNYGSNNTPLDSVTLYAALGSRHGVSTVRDLGTEFNGEGYPFHIIMTHVPTFTRNSISFPALYMELWNANALQTNALYTAEAVNVGGAGILIMQVGIPDNGNSGVQYESNGQNVNLTITEINDKYFKGTFGAVLLNEGDQTQFIDVTEGQFYLPRQDYE